MMTRLLQSLGVCVAVALAAGLVYNGMNSPANARRPWLAKRIEEAKVVPPNIGQTPLDLARVEKSVAAKPALWKELVAAPPPPVAAPDLKKMLEGVNATRQEIGDKIKLTTKANPRGEYVGQGDAFMGLSVKSISPKEIVFSLNQNGQEYTLSLPRQ